jgi:hypothetical protein
MLFVSRGLHQLTLALRNRGFAGISDQNSQYDGNEKTQMIRQNNYEQRFGFFKAIPFPQYSDYNSQIVIMDKQGPFDQLLHHAKLNL